MCDSASSSAKRTVYGVTRRFDLATIMVVSVAFALLFTLLRLTVLPAYAIFVVLAFVVAVGIAQALLFSGKHPRLASLAAGAVLGQVMLGFAAYRNGYQVDLERIALYAISYATIGYVIGGAIAGVFLIADRMRSFDRRTRMNRR